MTVCFLCGAFPGTGLAAGETRSAGRHEHGSTALGIAVEGQSLVIELDGPAANFLGFERKPANDQEKQELARVLNVLRDGATLFLMPEGAHCRLQSAAVSPPDYGADGHANLEAFWEFRCGSPPALTWIEAKVFTAFPGTVRLPASVVTAAGQKAVVLTPGTTRVLLPQ
ncbi:MAG: DUF2796 domain-containing protein [Chromatiales bacterium]|nr:DUF2796 domain-containing protein [Chromatiales bacterium]